MANNEWSDIREERKQSLYETLRELPETGEEEDLTDAAIAWLERQPVVIAVAEIDRLRARVAELSGKAGELERALARIDELELELELSQAFHNVVVKERNAAWAEVERIKKFAQCHEERRWCQHCLASCHGTIANQGSTRGVWYCSGCNMADEFDMEKEKP